MPLNFSIRRSDFVRDSSDVGCQVVNCFGQRDPLSTDYHLVKALTLGWSD